MELVGQIGLLALAFWVVLAAMGKKSQAVITRAPQKKRMNPRSVVWNQSPVVAPNASAGLLFTPGVVMYPGELTING
jgi:hypothetical protein